MIELLVDRLRWPAALVRERAADQIAELIDEGRQDVCDALLAWIGRQELESRACAGILPFMKVKELTNIRPVDAQELAETCRARSVLSDVFIRYYDPSYADTTTPARHFGLPPAGWHPPYENRETPAAGLRQAFVQRLQLIDNDFHSSLARQFEFERAKLCELHGESPISAFRLAGTRQEGFHPVWYTRSDEITTSAYLRTLASAKSNHGIPEWLIAHIASCVSPVDLGLWQVKSAAKPEWWPNLEAEGATNSIDTQTAAVIKRTTDAAKAWDSGPNVVLAASGCIFQSGLTQHELEVRSFFQQANGPLRPSTNEIFDEVRQTRARVNQQASPLRFEGSVSVDHSFAEISDWSIFSCSGTAHPVAMMSWQAWRSIREIQCPSDGLSDQRLQAVCRQYSVDFENAEGLIASWSDWSDGLSATSMIGLPPGTGWVLTAPRNVIEKRTQRFGMRLGWVWEVRSHFRENRHDDFQEFGSVGETRHQPIGHSLTTKENG